MQLLHSIHSDSNKDSSFQNIFHFQYPAIPADIAYGCGKTTTGAAKSGLWQRATGNPAVILGLGLTGAALMGMMRKAFVGDKFGAQRFMR